MLGAFGLDWRISLAQECLFYLRTCANWRDVIRARLRNTPVDRFVTRSGMVVGFTDPIPYQVFQEIWRRQIYTRAYPSDFGDPRVVVDVGANIGFFSLYTAQRWRTARIFAFEPAPENVELLKRNVILSRVERIVVRPAAVAGSVGYATMYLKQESGWHSLIGNGALSAVQVSTTTLDQIIDEVAPAPIDILKIDCEGSEYDALLGRDQLLSEHVRFVAMEYHEIGANGVSALLDIFARAGFRCQYYPEPRWHTGMLYAVNSRLK